MSFWSCYKENVLLLNNGYSILYMIYAAHTSMEPYVLENHLNILKNMQIIVYFLSKTLYYILSLCLPRKIKNTQHLI